VTYGEQTTDEMALLFLQLVLPKPEDAPRFRREFILSRLEQFLQAGGQPAGISRRAIAGMQALTPRFDANHNGTLEPDERASMLEFLATRIK
jgi:hypothetical protein